MRPVNLLPPELRPSRPTGARSGSAYVVVGALAAVLAAALVYVVFANQVSSRKDEVADLKAEAAEARAQAAPLAPFGDFAAVKETRIASVRQLAGGRLDWERLMRELALVIPERAWLTSFSGSTGGGAQAPTGGAQQNATDEPTVVLSGCAPRHRGVAEVMVRLRRVDGFRDVTLSESSRGGAAAESGTAQAQTAGRSGGDSAAGGCGRLNSFEVTLTLERPQPQAGDERVPVRLGGGS